MDALSEADRVALAARDFDRQAAEVQILSVLLNALTTLGIPDTVTVGCIRQGQGKYGLRAV